MSDPRKPILVRCSTHGYPDRTGALALECVLSSAYAGVGFYLMIPVKDIAEADELQKRLQDQPSGDSQ